MLIIDIKEKKYSKKTILKDVSINIDKPGIYGVIGKNGEGKTTLFKCALGLEKYEGDCRINEEKTSLQNTAFCSSETLIYEELTAAEFYKFYSALLGIKDHIGDELFELPKDKLIRDLSTGMKKKVYINALFQKNYSAYFLDEPFNGLDIESNYLLMRYLKEKSKQAIILISSHIIDILYRNCSSIFLLKDKKVSRYNPGEFEKIEEHLF